MPVDTLHPSYLPHEEQAQRSRDAVAGTDAIRRGGKVYLPHPQEEYGLLKGEAKTLADQRYEVLQSRAVWMGVTKRTHDGLLGAVFRKAPEIDLPNAISYMDDDADGSGGSLVQYAKVTTSSVIKAGAYGTLVDYPEAVDGLTREQTRGMRATFRQYSSDNVINWHREGERLTLVVLREPWSDEVDEFERTWDWQYRVLRLEDGVYTQQVYRDGQPAGEKVSPRKANGQRWERIPFHFFGALTNDENPDSPLLLEIADLNIAHYQSSADRREASHIVGQPMYHIDIGETNTDEWKELNPTGVQVGSRRGVQTRGGGSMAVVQPAPNDMSRQDMQDLEAQMLAIGARLLTGGGQAETAEAVRARSGAETSNLSTVAHNVSEGIRQCLEWAMEFMGGSGEIIFDLNQEFYPEDADPQMIASMMMGLDRGAWAMTDVRDWGRRKGLISSERTNEDIDADVQAGGTNLGAL